MGSYDPCKTLKHRDSRDYGHIYTYTVRVSVSESASETLTELCLHYIGGSDPWAPEAMAIFGTNGSLQ